MTDAAPTSFPRAAELSARLLELDEVGSTNDALRESVVAEPEAWPDTSLVVTGSQTAGRGRLGRVWVAPPGKTLAASLLVRPDERFGEAGVAWLPLLAGVAVARAVRSVLAPVPEREAERTPASVELKWPNDVLVDGAKVSGILCELLPDALGVVIGTGINLSLETHELPTERSTSLLLAGASDLRPDTVLAAYLEEFLPLYRALGEAGGIAVASGLHDAVVAECGTLGRTVAVELPTGETRTGTATAIDPTGRLVVETGDGPLVVSVGDVTHLHQ